MPLMTRSRTDKLKLFLALSRTPHGLLDMATPAFAALLCLGAFPSIGVTLVGVLAIFSGYTAVYALNDVVGYRTDKEKLEAGALNSRGIGGDLDAKMTRHPMAQGVLGYGEGVAWALGWGVAALVFGYILNPLCLLIFLAGCVLETVYCLLWRVSPYRALVNGVVKTLGAVAAVFAVDPSPDPLFLSALFLMLFCWEIGGQNIPNDWSDIAEDLHFGAKTIPVYFGAEVAMALILVALVFTAGFGFLLLGASPFESNGWIRFAFLVICGFLLLLPAWRLYLDQTPQSAMALFNKACYFPSSILVLVLVAITI